MALLVGNAVRATEANGPLCDLHNALTGCDNSAQWDAKRCSSKDMFARCCQPNFGPFGSGCASRAGGDSDISLQDGISNPTSTRACSQVLTASKQRAGWWSIPCMIKSATTGCLSLTILMQSAQLDQCAATLDLTADVSPRPPMESGKLAVTCASAGTPGDPRMAQRQPHTAASCRSAYC